MHPNNISSLGTIDCTDRTWTITLPLFNRSTLVLFSNLFIVRLYSAFPFLEYGLNISGNALITEDYYLENGVYKLGDVTVGRFFANGEHSEIIKWEIDVDIEMDHIQKVFDALVLEMYSRI